MKHLKYKEPTFMDIHLQCSAASLLPHNSCLYGFKLYVKFNFFFY